LKFHIFFGVFESFENRCHTMRAIGQTLKEKENYFSIFSNYLEESVTRRERPDRHNKNEREPFLFFYILIFMIFKYVCFPFLK